MIRIEDLHLTYHSANSTVHAVRGVNIEVQSGHFYTLLRLPPECCVVICD